VSIISIIRLISTFSSKILLPIQEISFSRLTSPTKKKVLAFPLIHDFHEIWAQASHQTSSTFSHGLKEDVEREPFMELVRRKRFPQEESTGT